MLLLFLFMHVNKAKYFEYQCKPRHYWMILFISIYDWISSLLCFYSHKKYWRYIFQQSEHLKLKNFSLGYQTTEKLKKENLWGKTAIEKKAWIIGCLHVILRSFSTFHATGLFLNPLKTSENSLFSDVPSGYNLWTCDMKWVKCLPVLCSELMGTVAQIGLK